MTTTKKIEQKPRRALHAYLSDEAHEAWHDFAAENGVSVSALLEVLNAPLNSDLDAPVVDVMNDVIPAARATDASRRRRSRAKT
jgi:hypothetical protein